MILYCLYVFSAVNSATWLLTYFFVKNSIIGYGSRVTFVFAGWSSPVARRAHNPKVVGSNPAPATMSLKFLETKFALFD